MRERRMNDIIAFCLAENVAGHHEQKIEDIEKHINTTQ
jgi:hypothetical protein